MGENKEEKQSWRKSRPGVTMKDMFLSFFALSEDLRDSQVLEGIGARSISNAKDVNNGNVLVELCQRR